jgi:hypothetical protein
VKAEPAAELLAQTRQFAGLSSDALLRIAGQARERSYRKGVVIFYEGDVGDAFSLVRTERSRNPTPCSGAQASGR